jgi:hypothetical protein
MRQKYFPLKTHISLLITATASKDVSHFVGISVEDVEAVDVLLSGTSVGPASPP